MDAFFWEIQSGDGDNSLADIHQIGILSLYLFLLSLSLHSIFQSPLVKNKKKSILEKKTTFQRQPKIQKQFECC